MATHAPTRRRSWLVTPRCGGLGGIFVQSTKFVAGHGNRIGSIASYGQESNYTTWRFAKMNLAVRGIDPDVKWNNESSFHEATVGADGHGGRTRRAHQDKTWRSRL